MRDGVMQSQSQADGDAGTREALAELGLPARTPDAAQLPVPRGAVLALARLLIQAKGDPIEAATVARHWAGGTDDPRFALIAGIIEEASR